MAARKANSAEIHRSRIRFAQSSLEKLDYIESLIAPAELAETPQPALESGESPQSRALALLEIEWPTIKADGDWMLENAGDSQVWHLCIQFARSCYTALFSLGWRAWLSWWESIIDHVLNALQEMLDEHTRDPSYGVWLEDYNACLDSWLGIHMIQLAREEAGANQMNKAIKKLPFKDEDFAAAVDSFRATAYDNKYLRFGYEMEAVDAYGSKIRRLHSRRLRKLEKKRDTFIMNGGNVTANMLMVDISANLQKCLRIAGAAPFISWQHSG